MQNFIKWYGHDDMPVRVQNGREFSEPFRGSNRIKQGYVLAPTLLSMAFSVMRTDACRDSDDGISVKYHFCDKLFNLSFFSNQGAGRTVGSAFRC